MGWWKTAFQKCCISPPFIAFNCCPGTFLLGKPRLHAMPNHIVFNCGVQFTSLFWKNRCSSLNIPLLFPSYHALTKNQQKNIFKFWRQPTMITGLSLLLGLNLLIIIIIMAAPRNPNSLLSVASIHIILCQYLALQRLPHFALCKKSLIKFGSRFKSGSSTPCSDTICLLIGICKEHYFSNQSSLHKVCPTLY